MLSEGVNLPRADIVINFDLPYNPVRLIQRAGRAIRLNNPKHIKIYNFKPDESIDKELELCERLKARVENIVATIGIEFIIWSIDQKKIEEFSEKNRKRVEDAIKEWKEKVATSNPEELAKIVESSLDKIDKTLRDFNSHYNISKETVEEYYHQYKKPIYTSLVGEKDGYFVVFKYRHNIYHCGELEFTINDRKVNFTKEDISEVEKLINDKKKSLDVEFLKSKSKSKDKLTNQIERIAKECGNEIERMINNEDIGNLSKHEKEKLLNILKDCKNNPPFVRHKFIEAIEEFFNSVKKHKNITLDKGTPLAIVKFVKDENN